MPESKCDTPKRPIMRAIHPETHEYYLFQPRCKMWACLPCANVNKLTWQAKVAHGYEVYSRQGYTDWRFVTITSHAKLKNEAQCLYVWRKAWPKLSARMRRKFPQTKYVILPEHHQDGRVHWHMIMTSLATGKDAMSTRWLKDACASVGLGYKAESVRITDGYQAIIYVSKYIGKGIHDTGWPPDMRRISTSQQWPILPVEDATETGVKLEWAYYMSYYAEGLDYIAHEHERITGIKTHIIGAMK